VSLQVVLSLDHWNAGLAGFCGGEPLLMPRVDRLAAESAVFDRHFSVSPAGDASVNGRAWAGGGWGTGPIADPAARRFGRAGGAAEVLTDVETEWVRLAGWESVRVVGEGLEDAVEEAVQRLSEAGAEHRLLWVAVSGPAEGVDGDWPDNLEELDSAMTTFDRCVGAALDGLVRTGLHGETLLVVTGGRGAWLGDRGFEDDKRTRLHEECLRSPLLLKGPTIEPGQRRLELVQVTDLLPTLLEWFEESPHVEELPGINLLALVGQEGGGHDEIVVRDSDGGWGIRSRDLFLVRPGDAGAAPRLFSKPDDPWDLVDVSAQGVADVERLNGRLDELIGAMRCGD
jgi:arylsulfatase A-like enzyme